MQGRMSSVGVIATLLLVTMTGSVFAIGQNGAGQVGTNGVHNPDSGGGAPETRTGNQGGDPGMQSGSGAGDQIREQDQARLRDGTGTGDQSRNKVRASSVSSSGAGTQTASQRKNGVAAAVQELLRIGERNDGVGQQVRTLAQERTRTQESIEAGLDSVRSRSGLSKLVAGPDFSAIRSVESLLVQNREQTRAMTALSTQLSDEGDKQNLMNQIRVLERADEEASSALSESKGGFSLFGWLFRLFAR